MSAETKCLTFLEILRLKNAELWESKLNHFTLLGRGDLQLLYSSSLDLSLLKFHNNTWVLDKNLQVIGTRSIRGDWQAYSLVAPGGFLCLKITGLDFLTKQHPELVNFEALVESRANFIRNVSLESRFDLFKEQPKTGIENVAGSILNVVHTITSTLSHSDYSNHPNYQIIRPIKELLDVDSTSVPVVDVPEKDLDNYKVETNMLFDYQGQGEWKDLWTAGNTNYSKDFSKMSLNDAPSQGQGQGQGQQKASEAEEPRLPTYETESTSNVHEGFEKASSNIQEGVNKTEEAKQEDTDFTTGLLKDNLETKPEPESAPKTPYHKNELENPPEELKLLPGQEEKKDLPKEALQMESWGSNVTNLSETTPTLDSDLKGEFRTSDNRTNLEKINSDSLKETAAP